MRYLIIMSVIVIQFADPAMSAPNTPIRDEILWLIGAVEFKAQERERLDRLGIDAVNELIEVMNNEMNPVDGSRAVILLARQYRIHLDNLDTNMKSKAISALARTTQGLDGWAIVAALDGLRGIIAPPIKALAQKMQNHTDGNVRAAALKLLESLD